MDDRKTVSAPKASHKHKIFREAKSCCTFPSIQFGWRNVERFGKTQNAPTQKSAMARLPSRKFVMLRSLGLLAMANNTIEFPVIIENGLLLHFHLISKIYLSRTFQT